MNRLLALIFFLSVSATVAGAQDLDKGLDAYDRGDYRAALAEWLPLASQGNASAQYYLRVIYEDDRNEPFDEVEGAKWLKAAANSGLGNAQFVLARRYYFGAGVPKDNVLAYMWLNIASGTQLWLSRDPAANFRISGDNAVRFRDLIVEKMTAAEIREAQRRTREWLDAHPQ